MITVNGKNFITLNEPIFVNDKRVLQVYANNVLVYPDEYPASIKVITKPTKFQYTDGEMIDLTGAVVQAYKADGSIWRSGKYINGIIPLNELTCEPTTVNAQSISSNHEYAGDVNGYSPILCASEETEIVFVQCTRAYDFSTGTYGERHPITKWTLKFTPTGGGVYSVVFNPGIGRLQVYLVQCVKTGKFDERDYLLEISWDAEFIVQPGYSDGTERGTQYLGYYRTREGYHDGGWWENLWHIWGTEEGGIDYAIGSVISYDRIPYMRITGRLPANYIDLYTSDQRNYIDMESSTAPLATSDTNYIYNSGIARAVAGYCERRLTSGMRNSLSSVTVKWQRPGDGQELTADFNIAISSAVPAQ